LLFVRLKAVSRLRLATAVQNTFANNPMRPPENLYHANIADDSSRSSCSLNRCNLSPWIIGSEEFQASPLPVEIDGVRTTNQGLFRCLAAIADSEERSRFFHDYLVAKFNLDETIVRQGRRRPIFSYLHLLRAWGADSNGPSGALMKSWVESRFGILATYHQGRLAEDAEARRIFLHDRTRGAAKSIGALMQLDLLYTFCQDELRRRYPGEQSQTLYRGTHDSEEYTVQTGKDGNSRAALVQLNNLSSFTADPEVAWEFGSSAWEVRVPFAKIVFFSGLLPKAVLGGEAEHLVLGGYYNVRRLIG
jgi:NAD+--dinitrogen-reductase ADP-D-ribosyltransferase